MRRLLRSAMPLSSCVAALTLMTPFKMVPIAMRNQSFVWAYTRLGGLCRGTESQMDQRSPTDRRALIVEDEPIIAIDLEAEMHSLGFGRCQLAAEPQEAFLLAMGDQLDVVLMNVDLKAGHDGIQAARWLRE